MCCSHGVAGALKTRRDVQDPVATQLPLAFALEPSLLPLAVANGFHMDSKVCRGLFMFDAPICVHHAWAKYRDFIFRKMFEKHSREGRMAEIMNNVREMVRLDDRCVVASRSRLRNGRVKLGLCSMFLSRTVAAEVCMECRTNEAGYLALKKLDLAGDLLFDLRDLVHDLLKACSIICSNSDCI